MRLLVCVIAVCFLVGLVYSHGHGDRGDGNRGERGRGDGDRDHDDGERGRGHGDRHDDDGEGGHHENDGHDHGKDEDAGSHRERSRYRQNNGWKIASDGLKKRIADKVQDLDDIFVNYDCIMEELYEKGLEYSAKMNCTNGTLYVNLIGIVTLRNTTIEVFPKAEAEGWGLGVCGPTRWCTYEDSEPLQYSFDENSIEAGKNCTWNFTASYFQVASGKNYLIQRKCGEEDQYVKIYQPLGPVRYQLGVLSFRNDSFDNSTGLQYLSPENLQNIIDTCINLKPFLKKKMDLPATIESAVFLQMPTGVQYLIDLHGEKDNKETHVFVAIFKYSLEGTKPFLVAHPFDDEDNGLQFLELVKRFAQPMNLNRMKGQKAE